MKNVKFGFCILLSVISVDLLANCTVRRFKDTVDGQELISQVQDAVKESAQSMIEELGWSKEKTKISLDFSHMDKLSRIVRFDSASYQLKLINENKKVSIQGYLISSATSILDKSNLNVVSKECELKIYVDPGQVIVDGAVTKTGISQDKVTYSRQITIK